MIAAEIAATLGGAHRSGAWWRCRCPVHRSLGPTLALRDGERSLVVRCWAGCDPCEVLAELRARGLLDDRRGNHSSPAMPMCRPDRDNDDTARRIALARRVWDITTDARGSPVMSYLAARGIDIEPPPVLRWDPRCWHREVRAKLPAMVSRVDAVDGSFIGILRTYIRPDSRGLWHRRDRATLGPIAGGAVRLAPAAETLITGEGIETTLAAMTATGLPGWSALSTSGLVALVLPPIVRTVIIAADHDANGAGERAARTAAARWLAEGRRVRIAMPPEPDSDMADVLVGRSCAGVGDAGT